MDQGKTAPKNYGIATLFTKESVEVLGSQTVDKIQQLTKMTDFKIKCLNGNQTPQGLQDFIDTYQDVIVVVANPWDGGVMNNAIKEKGVDSFEAKDFEKRIIQRYENGVFPI